MGFLGNIVEKMKDAIPPEQRTGAEDIAMGAAHAAAGVAVAKEITPDIAQLAQGAAASLKGAGVAPATEMATNAAIPGAGKSQELQVG